MVDKLIVDCETGERHTESWTDEDEADRQAVAQAAADREAAREAEEQAWRDAIRNASSMADLKAVLAGDTEAGQAERRPV